MQILAGSWFFYKIRVMVLAVFLELSSDNIIYSNLKLRILQFIFHEKWVTELPKNQHLRSGASAATL